jgi:hypothetical protein
MCWKECWPQCFKARAALHSGAPAGSAQPAEGSTHATLRAQHLTHNARDLRAAGGCSKAIRWEQAFGACTGWRYTLKTSMTARTVLNRAVPPRALM